MSGRHATAPAPAAGPYEEALAGRARDRLVYKGYWPRPRHRAPGRPVPTMGGRIVWEIVADVDPTVLAKAVTLHHRPPQVTR